MGTEPRRRRSAAQAEALIDDLYEVACDPTRYESLLSRWERVVLDGDPEDQMGSHLSGLEPHVARALRLLDRLLYAGRDESNPATAVDRQRSTPAFAADRHLRVVAANDLADRALGAAPGRQVRDLPFGGGEPEALASHVERLFHAADGTTDLLGLHDAGTGKMVLVHLRLHRPEAGPSFVLAVTSELVWPEGFGAMLQSAFRLTLAEIAVVRGLAEGQALGEIAATRGRSLDTVRAQLKSAMQKTESRSQSELVRLTLSVMEMARHATEAVAGTGKRRPGTGRLAPRPFQSLALPDGRRLDYLILGDPAGRPCLFFPLDFGLVRWPASAEAAAARAGIRIVVPVRAGYGRSTPLPRHADILAGHVDDHLALLDHLGIARLPAISLGDDSLIAIALQAAQPGRISGLVACAGVLPLTRPEQYARMARWHRFIIAGARYTPHLLPFMVKAGFAMARRLGKGRFVHAVYGTCPADIATFEDPEVMEAMLAGSEVALSDSHMAHDAFAREIRAHERTDWSGPLAALESSGIPVVFLNGVDDPQVPPETVDDFRRDYPWIDFRQLPDAGQLLFFRKWREVLALVEPWLDRPMAPGKQNSLDLAQMGYDRPDAAG